MNRIWHQNSCLVQQTAHLMAGHAAIALFEGLEVLHVSMGRSHLSWIEVAEPDFSKSRLCSSEGAREDAKSVIRALLAGPAAQIRYSFGYYPTEFNLANRLLLDQEAIWRAIALASKVTDNSPALIHNAWKDAMEMVGAEKIWATIEEIAEALLNNGELVGYELIDVARRIAGFRR